MNSVQQYDNSNIPELLEYIDPAELDYSEWISVGMAIKEAGFQVGLWDSWSRRDPHRYHPGECDRKWNSLNGMGITAGTIVKMALDGGYQPKKGRHELDWDDEIGAEKDALKVVDSNWLDAQPIEEPAAWDPAQELITYLETLFDSDENVGYVTESWEKDGRCMPKKGCYDRTAGELISELYKCNGDIGKVVGDYNESAGAWIRFNPLDGKGVKNENVTDFKYALVESDTMDLEQQAAVMRELELPIACMVYSGGKSIHAIVKIYAGSYEEYRNKVDYLYKVCDQNGLQIDKQNRNPSRLSRMPGVIRKGKKQYLIDTNIGKESFDEWKDWIESLNDDLPDEDNLQDFWNDLPPLSEPLIDGVLRKGHKMLIAGPSKAGKSYLLIELCIALAEGKSWMGFNCRQGKVLYVNLELDRASCLHRFKDVYIASKTPARNLQNIDIWNLRGKSVPMDKLAPKLIRRASKKDYTAIVIDPIYKIITGDENSADQMAAFCNQFDKVCTELGCAVIYCHHHSKGSQGGKKSMDRASGSGVFARDPDALLDLMELELSDGILKQEANNETCRICFDWLKRYNMESYVNEDDRCSQVQMMAACKRYLREASYNLMLKEISESKGRHRTAWRIEGTLREFPRFEPKNLWFDFPVHSEDKSGILADLVNEDSYTWKGSNWKKNFSNKKSPEEKANDRHNALVNAFDNLVDFNGDGRKEVKISDIAESTGKSADTVRRWATEFKNEFYIIDGALGKR